MNKDRARELSLRASVLIKTVDKHPSLGRFCSACAAKRTCEFAASIENIGTQMNKGYVDFALEDGERLIDPDSLKRYQQEVGCKNVEVILFDQPQIKEVTSEN